MSERRIIRQRVGDVDALPDDIHPLLRRIYAGRGVASSEELDYSLQRLPDPARLRGMSDAVALLASHLGGRILVVGDFDADGATSCALAVRALESMGGADIGYLVPDRFRYGYGLTPEIVELARARRPDLIVTVDNGISSHQGVAAARAAGIDVLVTDHHLPGRELPDANVIVNPHLPGDTFAGRHLAGVGVIFHVMLALRRHLRAQGHFGRAGLAEPNMAEFLDLVALGTIADVVQLDHCNRVLVDQGLRRLRAGKGCPGIRALAAVAGRDERRMTAADLGFAVGPRLNAAGRLDDMSLGIECLLARRMDAAREMAARLDQLNRERRKIEATMKSE
ncbi:MAG: DHH family phosphoesterase, partial [Gammaproteobacteria bacterium]